MAIEVIGTPQSNALNNTAITLTFDVAPREGDVVIVWNGHDANASSSVTPTTSGYTQVINDTANLPYFGVFYKRMTSTPDTTVVCPASGAANDGNYAGAIVLRGVAPAVLGATTTTAGPTASTNPDPNTITTTKNNSMVLAVAVSSVFDNALGTVSGYTVVASNSVNVSGVDISGSGAYLIRAAAGTENPPTWSAWSSGTWKTATLEILAGTSMPVVGNFFRPRLMRRRKRWV